MTVKVYAKTDKTVYYPGEKIVFNATVENLLGTSVRKTYVQLVERLIVVSKKEKALSEVFTTIHAKQTNHDKLKNKCTQEWKNVELEIPQCCPPSGLNFCNRIKISYVVQLVVDIGFFLGDLEFTWDIVIKNTPPPSVASASAQKQQKSSSSSAQKRQNKSSSASANSSVTPPRRSPSVPISPVASSSATTQPTDDAIQPSVPEEMLIDLSPPRYEEYVAQRDGPLLSVDELLD